MPYHNISELPKTKTADIASPRRKRFSKPTTVAYEEHGHDGVEHSLPRVMTAEGGGRKLW